MSYHKTSGNYSHNDQYFVNQFKSGPLHVFADVPSSGNGVFKASGSPTFLSGRGYILSRLRGCY